ncbi:MAG: OmpA family protein, partial [Paracoccaceae bacterium]
MGTFIFAAFAALMHSPDSGSALEFPAGAILTTQSAQPFTSTTIPIGVFSDGIVPMLSAEGTVLSQAWKIISNTLTTLQMITPLRDQLTEDGYEILLDCETDQCGGFDFRF